MRMELFNLLFLLSFASANHVAVKDFTFGFCGKIANIVLGNDIRQGQAEVKLIST